MRPELLVQSFNGVSDAGTHPQNQRLINGDDPLIFPGGGMGDTGNGAQAIDVALDHL